MASANEGIPPIKAQISSPKMLFFFNSIHTISWHYDKKMKMNELGKVGSITEILKGWDSLELLEPSFFSWIVNPSPIFLYSKWTNGKSKRENGSYFLMFPRFSCTERQRCLLINFLTCTTGCSSPSNYCLYFVAEIYRVKIRVSIVTPYTLL